MRILLPVEREDKADFYEYSQSDSADGRLESVLYLVPAGTAPSQLETTWA